MKVDIILGWAFGFIVFTAVLITLHEYIQYQLRKYIKNKVKPTKHPVEGVYFNRFIPLTLKQEFQDKLHAHKKSMAPHIGDWKYIVSVTLLTFYVFCIYEFVSLHSYKLFDPIDLSVSEKKDLVLENGSWKFHDDFIKTKLTTVLNFEKKQIVIIKTLPENTPNRDRLSAFVDDQLNYWTTWANLSQSEIKVCHWSRLKNCRMNPQKQQIVVLSSFWEQPVIESWLQQGYSVTLYSAPFQILNQEESEFRIDELKIERFKRSVNEKYSIRLLGEKSLTVGLDAGLYIHSPKQKITNYKATTSFPQAVTVDLDKYSVNIKDTRLFAKPLEKGRLVWLDIPFDSNFAKKKFSDLNLKALYSNWMLYTHHKEYSTVSSWPQGKPFAAVLEQDTEDQFQNSGKLISIFKRHKFPVTWFMLSDLAERNKRLANQMAEVGEVSCHGDNHDVFPDGSLYRQIYRLAKCRKVLAEITDRTPAGFRPPEEKYNRDTFDAVLNNKFSYIFTEFQSDRLVPKIYKRLKDGAQIVVFNRFSRDDYHLWGLKKYTEPMSRDLINEDIEYAKTLGGLYSFSFHSQYMDSSERVRTIEMIIKNLNSSQVYASTMNELQKWWQFRYDLIHNQKPDKELVHWFQPKKVVVKKDGQVYFEKI